MSINFSFRQQHGEFDLELDHAIPGDGITAVFGPSGSGKTSLLRLIAGLDTVPDGRISYGVQQWQDESVFLETRLRDVGYVFQEPSLFEHLSVHENLAYAVKRASNKRDSKTQSAVYISYEHAVKLTQIETLLERDSASLSGGEKQRVAIARALCASPRVLLMDEPLAALDRESKQRILALIPVLSRDLSMPIVYVSHALDEVARIADHLLLIRSGRVLGSGDAQTMLTELDYPLAQSADAESLVEAVVAEHDTAFNLTYLDSKIGRFSVAKQTLSIGENVRLMLAARDVSITKDRQSGTSILNIFAAQVDAVVDTNASQVTVKLMSNGVPLLARITKKSASSLGLVTGDSVFLQAKSVALL